MSESLESELGITPQASLEAPNSVSWNLETSTASIPISTRTAIRQHPRCLIVGRQAKSADIRIQHGSISRRHAALYFLDNDCLLEDFGSKKGTLVNGQPVRGKQILKADDVIIFGTVRESAFKVVNTIKKDTNSGTRSTEPSEAPSEPPREEQAAAESENVVERQSNPALTGRAKREAEIAAMMQSLEQTPEYQKYIPPAGDASAQRNSQSPGHNQPSSKQETAEALDQITKVAKQHKLPINERMTLSQDTERRHVVTCLAMDPSGARFIVGTTDNTLRLYDFGGMDRLRRDPFKILQADEGHVVSDLCYSNTGDRILVGTGSVQPYVLDRDGGEM